MKKRELNISIFKGIELVDEELIQKAQVEGALEVYDESTIESFLTDFQKGITEGSVTTEDFEKAKKDFSKLQKRVITDKKGNRRTVYIKVGEKLSQDTHSYKEKEESIINPSKQSKEELYEAVNKKYGTSFKVGDIDEFEDDEFRKELTKDDIENIVEDEKENKKEDLKEGDVYYFKSSIKNNSLAPLKMIVNKVENGMVRYKDNKGNSYTKSVKEFKEKYIKK
jgi:hypothetical protein